MFKFVITIEYSDGTTYKKECYSLDEAVSSVKANALSSTLPKGVTVKEIVLRTKPWL